MLATFRLPSNTNKRKQKFSKTDHEPKKSQMSPNDLVVNSVTETVEPIKSVKSKTNWKVLEVLKLTINI